MKRFKYIVIFICVLSFSCNEVKEHKSEERNQELTLNKIEEYDSISQCTYYYSIDSLNRKQGNFVCLNKNKEVLQKGFFYNNLLVGYMSYFENGSLFEKRTYQLISDNTVAMCDFIRYKDGKVDSNNSCFVKWDLEEDIIIPEFKDTFNLIGELSCNNRYDNFQVIQWINDVPDTSYLKNKKFEFTFTKSNIDRENNLIKLNINYLDKNDSSYFVHSWRFPIKNKDLYTQLKQKDIN